MGNGAGTPSGNGHEHEGLEGRGSSDLGIEEAVLAALKKALTDIDYGSVLLKIHQGQVVGIETSTKLRLG